ncbi:histidine kinase [Roseisolibacter agri]|uniref:histidine kinase n=2 Tax=Roseisolibacter agri TaxID=2014610 RepID=A0AA37QG75_9BACT|nr:histidine kinase [Roseisolibacter agri]
MVARVFERVSDAVVCVDRDWRFTYLNARAGVLVGREPRTLLGHVAWDELPELVGHPLHTAALRAMERAEAATVQATLPGTTRAFELRLEPFGDGLAVIGTELPGTAPSDARLVEQSRYLRAVLDTAPDCVKVLARDGALLDINASGLAMLDAPSLAAVRGRDVLPLVAEADRAPFRAMLDATFAGEVRGLEFDVVTFTGRRRRFETDGAPLRDALGAVVGALFVTRDVTERRAVEERLRESETRFRMLAEAAPLGVFMNDALGNTLYVNEQCAEIMGRSRETLLNERWADLVNPMDVAEMNRQRLAFRNGDAERSVFELRVRRPDGSSRTLTSHAVRLRAADGTTTGFVGMVEDTTERLALEAQLRQAQKMEAVGQLAGGIAHDFNNLLTVITGHLDFARQDLAPLVPPGHSVREDLAEIAQAAERARALVRQLLAFSRKQVVAPQEVDVSQVVRGAEQLLRRVLGDEIVLGTTLAAESAVVRADAVQLEQVLVNLALNARDAMLTPMHGHPGTGGTLTIETDVQAMDAGEARRMFDTGEWALPSGPYVRLTVRDSGHGMDDATRARLFEPFFTTKPIGAGTGLGLATVYGIVQQSGGEIRVDSAPGAGTTFTILLPRVVQPTGEPATGAASARPTAGRGTVLLVEDETAVRATTRRVLERQGYTVLEARHGADALMLWQAHHAEVLAVVTDLRMPEMGGRELVALLRRSRERLPVVYVSGYSDEAAQAAARPYERFIEKPFASEALLSALDAAVGAAART